MMLPAEVEKKRFTVEEFHKMGEAGILGEGDRVELVEGEIVEMTPIGWRHVQAVNAVNDVLSSLPERGRYTVSVQNPLVLDEHGEHYPDLALLWRSARPRQRVPTAADALLVVEVAYTSLSYDRDVKLPLYARAGIPEVWIVDLNFPSIELYSRPSRGRYESVRSFAREESLRSEALPGLEVEASEILPSS